VVHYGLPESSLGDGDVFPQQLHDVVKGLPHLVVLVHLALISSCWLTWWPWLGLPEWRDDRSRTPDDEPIPWNE